MSLIDIQTKAAQYKFKLTTTSKKRLDWSTKVAPFVTETLNHIIETAALQNFAHVIKTAGTDGLIIYMNLLYIEKGVAEILDSSDKENLKTGRQLAFKPMQSGDIGVYFCEHENGEYVATFIASHDPQEFNTDVLVIRYVDDFLESVIK